MNWNESAITGDKETINKKTKQFNNYILSNPNLKNIDFLIIVMNQIIKKLIINSINLQTTKKKKI